MQLLKGWSKVLLSHQAANFETATKPWWKTLLHLSAGKAVQCSKLLKQPEPRLLIEKSSKVATRLRITRYRLVITKRTKWYGHIPYRKQSWLIDKNSNVSSKGPSSESETFSGTRFTLWRRVFARNVTILMDQSRQLPTFEFLTLFNSVYAVS